MTDPLWTPVVPDRPSGSRPGGSAPRMTSAGVASSGEEFRRLLLEAVGPRARDLDDVRALRAWVDLEVPETFRYFLRRFEPDEPALHDSEPPLLPVDHLA